MQLIMSDFQNKPQAAGLPSLPQVPILLSLPLASTRPLLPPDFSHPLLSLSPPKKPAAGLGAAAAGGAAAGRAAEGPGAAGPAAGGSLPGGLCAQREPGAGGHPAQAGGAEVGSRGLGGPGGERAGRHCKKSDAGERMKERPSSHFSLGLSLHNHPPALAGGLGH